MSSGWAEGTILVSLGLLAVYVVPSVICLPFSWRRQNRARKRASNLMLAMADAYNPLSSSGPVSANRVHDLVTKAADMGVVWPPPCLRCSTTSRSETAGFEIAGKTSHRTFLLWFKCAPCRRSRLGPVVAEAGAVLRHRLRRPCDPRPKSSDKSSALAELRIHQRSYDEFDDALHVFPLRLILRRGLARPHADTALNPLGDETDGLDVAAAGEIDGARRQHVEPGGGLRGPSCLAENTTSRRFCAGCGRPLASSCPACGLESSQQPSSAAATSSLQCPRQCRPPLAPIARSGASSRSVYCDLVVGSTEVAARLDPEDLRQVIGAYQPRDRRSGRRVRWLRRSNTWATAFWSISGYPQAHEDDAERAVLAGLDVVGAVSRLDVKSVKLQARVVGDLIGEGSAQE